MHFCALFGSKGENDEATAPKQGRAPGDEAPAARVAGWVAWIEEQLIAHECLGLAGLL